MTTNGNSSSSNSSLKGDAPEFVPQHHEHAQHEVPSNYAPSPPQYYGALAYGQYTGYQYNGPSQYQPMPDFYPVPANGVYPSLPPPGQYYPPQVAPWSTANGDPVHPMDPFSRQMRLVEEARMAENAQSYHDDDYNNAPEQTAHNQNNNRKKAKKGKKSKKGKKAAAGSEAEEGNGERVEDHRA